MIDFESDSEEEEVEDIRDRKDWDRFDSLLRDINSIPVCGYKVNNHCIEYYNYPIDYFILNTVNY